NLVIGGTIEKAHAVHAISRFHHFLRQSAKLPLHTSPLVSDPLRGRGSLPPSPPSASPSRHPGGWPIHRRRCCPVRSWQSRTGTPIGSWPDRRSTRDSRPTSPVPVAQPAA